MPKAKPRRKLVKLADRRLFFWGDPVRHRETGDLYRVVSDRGPGYADDEWIAVRRLAGPPWTTGRLTRVKAGKVDDIALPDYSRAIGGRKLA